MRIIFLLLILTLSCRDEGTNTTTSVVENLKESNGKITVVIAIADASQEPLVFKDGTGISKDLVSELNTIQNKYIFNHEIVPTKRMKKLAAEGKVNVVSFSNPAWGWDKNKIQKSDDLIHDKDVFFTLNGKEKDTSFFDGLNGRSIVGVKGFDYNFSKEETSFIAAQNEQAVIDMVLMGRGELGVASILAFKHLSTIDKDKYSKLFISDKYDKEYKRSYLVVNDGPITVEEVNSYITELRKNGLFAEVLSKYGIIEANIKK